MHSYSFTVEICGQTFILQASIYISIYLYLYLPLSIDIDIGLYLIFIPILSNWTFFFKKTMQTHFNCEL